MQTNKRNRIIVTVVSIVVAILVAFGVRLALGALTGSDQSTAETVTRAVGELKETTTLPQQIDEVTSLDEVTAEDDTIHYQYTLTGVDAASITDEALTETILPTLCSTDETKDLLDQDVQMRYSYEIEEAGDAYDLTFTKADC